MEFLRLRDANVLERGIELLLRESREREDDKCHNHLHSEAQPRCVPKEVIMIDLCSSGWRA